MTISSLGRDFFLNPIDEIETLTIPVENGYKQSRTSHAGAILELDFEKNKKAINEFFGLTDNEQPVSDVQSTDDLQEWASE